MADDPVSRRMRNTGETREEAERAILKLFQPDGAERLFYLQFFAAPPGHFRGDLRLVGSCIVSAESPMLAVQVSHKLGCNPGGAVQVLEIPSLMQKRVPERRKGVLLSLEDCRELHKELLWGPS